MCRNVGSRAVGCQVLASLLLLTGIALNPWLLAWVFKPLSGGRLSPAAACFVLFFDIVCIALGLGLLRSKSPAQRRRAIYALVMVTAMVIFVEGCLQVAFLVVESIRPQESSIPARVAWAYSGKDWAEDLWTEYRRLRPEYDPVTGWAYKNFHGRYITIDERGARQTCQPEGPASDRDCQIFIFGGSAVFGWGNRNEQTISSWLSMVLNERGIGAFRVTNFGQPGYTLAQELFRLVCLLREGARPDIVVFMDGYNDCIHHYSLGSVGELPNVAQIRDRLARGDPSPAEHLVLGMQGIVQEHCRTYQLINRLSRQGDKSGDSKSRAVGDGFTEAELASFVQQVGEDYCRLVELAVRLGEIYQFECLCLWQPMLVLDKTPTADEISHSGDSPAAQMNRPRFNGFCKDVHACVVERSPDGFFDLGSALEGRTESLFVDLCHLTDEGNRRTAERIADVLQQTGSLSVSRRAVP